MVAVRLLVRFIGFFAVPNICKRCLLVPAEFASNLLCTNKLVNSAEILEDPSISILNKEPDANSVASCILPELFVVDANSPEAIILALIVDIEFI